MTNDTPTATRALAIAEIIDHNEQLLDEIEGHLLVAAGRSQRITPATVARDTSLTRESASDLFRQLGQWKAVHRDSYDDPIAETRHSVQADAVRTAIGRTRDAIQVVAAHRERVPETTVMPLVTFPDDPAFADTTAAEFGMSGLMSTLASEVKQSEQEIVLLAPFFEGGGFDRLADVLLDALERDVELTIVTRYLSDRTSHNYAVISEFIDRARKRGVSSSVTAVDYTVWGDDVAVSERQQGGVNPAFTLHAKVMLFDARSVYVGSANVTDYGFDRYLELGVLLEGAKVKPYRELCSFLLQSDGAVTVNL